MADPSAGIIPLYDWIGGRISGGGESAFLCVGDLSGAIGLCICGADRRNAAVPVAGEQGRTGGNRIVSGVTFAAMIFLLFSLQTSKTAVEPGLGAYLFCGFALALSVIAPGMSFSTLLMPLGLYTPFVEGIGHLRPEVLIPGMTGCVVTFVCLARLVNRLLEKQYAGMFHGIFGIISAATVMTVPWNSFATSPETASRNLFCMAAGIVAALLLEVMNEKMACFPENETE